MNCVKKLIEARKQRQERALEARQQEYENYVAARKAVTDRVLEERNREYGETLKERIREQDRLIVEQSLKDLEAAPAPAPPPEQGLEPIPKRIQDFIDKNAVPVDLSTAPNKECTFCGRPHMRFHPCVQIKETCLHMIGKACLIDYLRYEPDLGKDCPVCETKWIGNGPMGPLRLTSIMLANAEKKEAEANLAKRRDNLKE